MTKKIIYCNGTTYKIEQTLDTRHGFKIYKGRPVSGPVGFGAGPAQYIHTDPLKNYLRRTQPRHVDLPISRQTCEAIRKKYGYTSALWWSDREQDLQTLTPAEFAAKHNISVASVRLHQKALTDRYSNDSLSDTSP